ncbi:hypothetical protein Hanom_Chr02g00146601 [Helianthus anomalus]
MSSWCSWCSSRTSCSRLHSAMNKLDLTDFHINNLKSTKDLNISRWKRIERWNFINLSTLLHSIGENGA